MSGLAHAAAVAIIISCPLMVRGHGFGLLRPRATVAYYCPAPVQYVPVVAYNAYPVCVPAVPVSPSARPPSSGGRIYAPPTPAPPSAGPSTPEPPLAVPPGPAKPSPAPPGRSLGFGESTSFYDAYSVSSQDPARSERCRVDFWNLTDRDLALRIDGGPPQVLPRGKSSAVQVGRHFTWQAEGREMQTTDIDRSESALQIVIRR